MIMAIPDRERIVNQIVSKLEERGTSEAAIKRITQALLKASVRPIRVLFECCDVGEVSTEVLATKYGYNQAPRAARDLRELGFAVKTKTAKTQDGRRMAVYYIDDYETFQSKEGRTAFSKKEKEGLLGKHGEKCFYCQGRFAPNELQIDHRIPFEVAGNSEHLEQGLDALILVCSSCNRRKSWSCEGCDNFNVREVGVCHGCYWYDPDEYIHVCGNKRVILNFNIDESSPIYPVLSKLSRVDMMKLITKSLMNEPL
jgi:5-methylcytosine-specific restriction endonuclease McrA